MTSGTTIIGTGAICAMLFIAVYVWGLFGLTKGDGSVTSFLLATLWPLPILAAGYAYVWAIQF